MKKNNLFVGILLVLVGFMLLFFPKRCISIVVALMGIEAVVNGIYSLVHTRKLVPDSDFQKLVFIRGTLSIVVGLLAFFLPLVVEMPRIALPSQFTPISSRLLHLIVCNVSSLMIK